MSKITNVSRSEAEARLKQNKPQYRIRAQLFFQIDNLMVETSVLGASLHFRRSDCDVEIILPSDDSAIFQNQSLKGRTILEKDSLTVNGTAFSSVHMLSVIVKTTSAAETIDSRVESVAYSTISEFVDWYRVNGQTWLGFQGKQPNEIRMARNYIDEETAAPPDYAEILDIQEIFESLGGQKLIDTFLNDVASAVDEHSLLLVHSQLSLSRKPPVPEQMLADARYFERSKTRDPLRTLLFSAIACELKIKDVLLRAATDETRPLVDLLLNNPRDYSARAASLFDKAAKVTFGRSLREDNKALFKKVGRLFEVRNHLVHSGTFPAGESAEYVDTATETFKWLNQIPQKATGPMVLVVRNASE